MTRWWSSIPSDIIDGMKEVLTQRIQQGKNFFEEYGKVICILLALTILFSIFCTLYSLLTPQKLRISFLDVGQGDAILIQTPSGHTMLVDGGVSDVVLEKVSEKISYFTHHLDLVVATHPDADHITGLIPILQKYEIDHIVVSPMTSHTGVFEVLQKSIEVESEEQAVDHHAQVHTAVVGDEIIFDDGVVAYILYPGAAFHGDQKDTNSASVSLVVTYGSESILLTGDLPSIHEGELLGGTLPHNVTIYKAGHHGSKFSSGEQLLSYIHPEYVVISAGKDNKYGHPNGEALSRLKIYAKEILSTVDRGSITFLLDGKTVQLETDK